MAAEQLSHSLDDSRPLHDHSDKLRLFVEPSDLSDLHIFAGTASRELAAEVAAKLDTQLGRSTIRRFADGEVSVVIHDSVRGDDIFVIQSTAPSVNDNLMELLLTISALRRASARSITAIVPYFGYSRQDKVRDNEKTLAAADVAKMLETMGVDRVVSVDLHVGQIEGFFSPQIPVDNLEPYLAAIPYFAKKKLIDPVVVGPSFNGVARAKRFRDQLMKRGIDARIAFVVAKSSRDIVDSDSGHSSLDADTMELIGDVKNSDVIIVDDLIETGSRVVKTAEILQKQGARNIFAFATHGLFQADALTMIQHSALKEVVVTNTIPIKEYIPKIRQLSVSGILAEVTRRLHLRGVSISDIYTSNKL